jgi:hypothetical protein
MSVYEHDTDEDIMKRKLMGIMGIGGAGREC